MEDDLNGRRSQWKTTSREDNLNERQLQLNTTSIKDDLNQRQPQWKTTSIEDEDNLYGRQPQRKKTSMVMTSIEDEINKRNLNGRRPQWKTTSMENIIMSIMTGFKCLQYAFNMGIYMDQYGHTWFVILSSWMSIKRL